MIIRAIISLRILNKMDIVPISISKPDWQLFIKATHKAIGYSPTRIIDSQNLQIGNTESFLHALGYFKSQEYDIKKILETTLDHIYISFFMELDGQLYTQLLESTKNIDYFRSEESRYKNDVVIIATGNLYSWRNICINLNNTFEARQLSYKIYEILISIGYKNIFNDYKIIQNVDGSSQLERR
jgi:hypothetical protein